MTIMLEATEAKRVSPAPVEKATRSVNAVCVGRRLHMKRTSSGISEAELSKKLGIGRGDLTAYEQGAKRYEREPVAADCQTPRCAAAVLLPGLQRKGIKGLPRIDPLIRRPRSRQ